MLQELCAPWMQLKDQREKIRNNPFESGIDKVWGESAGCWGSMLRNTASWVDLSHSSSSFRQNINIDTMCGWRESHPSWSAGDVDRRTVRRISDNENNLLCDLNFHWLESPEVWECMCAEMHKLWSWKSIYVRGKKEGGEQGWKEKALSAHPQYTLN